MGKILITGGAGYVGSHVNKVLADRGYDTLILDNLVCGLRSLVKWGNFVLADLANKDQLRLIFEMYDIDAVMHFAAFANVGESVADPQKYYQNNVVNTINLIEIMFQFGVKTLIFSSTCATYGIPKEIPIPETHPQNPINPYGRSKLIIENILADYSHAYSLGYASLRYFNAAGADPLGNIGEWHEPGTHLIPLILDAAYGRRKEIKIFGTNYDTRDGTCIRDYIHVTDLAEAHVLALEYLIEGGQSDVFNLGNGDGFSVREVIACAREVTKQDIPVQEVMHRPGDPPVLVGGAKKARERLGWSPKHSDLDEIVRTAWKWHQQMV